MLLLVRHCNYSYVKLRSCLWSCFLAAIYSEIMNKYVFLNLCFFQGTKFEVKNKVLLGNFGTTMW